MSNFPARYETPVTVERAHAHASDSPTDLVQEIAIARSLRDQAIERYESAHRAWEQMDGGERMLAISEGARPPHTGEVLACLETIGRLSERHAKNESRDSIPIQSVMDFMAGVRALVSQFVPDAEVQRVLLDSISRLEI